MGSMRPRAVDLAGLEADGGPPIDPLADLIFTLIAALLPAIFVLAPLLRSPSLAEAGQVRPATALAARPDIRVDGRPVETIVAGSSGVRLAGSPARRFGLDAIPSDPALARVLDDVGAAGKPLLLVVEPDGLESAFLLEPLLARHGVTDLREMRLAEPCDSTRDPALQQACDAFATAP